MRKVLHYKTNFLNPSETFIARLVNNHDRYQPFALCYRKKWFTDNTDIYQVPKSGIEGWVNFIAFHTNLTLPYYRRTLKKIEPDLIHAHFGYDAYKLKSLSEKLRIPLVVSFYGSDVSRLPTEFGWKRRYKKLAKIGDHFIAATNFMKYQLIGLGFPENKISIVRFGLDVETFEYQSRSSNPEKMMMVGRMVEKKGFNFAIRAISNLQGMGKNPELNIYGYGSLEESLKNLVNQLDLSNCIQFHGYQQIRSIMDAHNQHTLLIAPSITASDGDMEGLPNTILEAMAKGTIVVASNHAAIPEVVKDKKTGFLFEERDVKGLTNTLKKILDGEFDLVEISQNARSLIEREYGVHRMVQEVENIYDRVKS